MCNKYVLADLVAETSVLPRVMITMSFSASVVYKLIFRRRLALYFVSFSVLTDLVYKLLILRYGNLLALAFALFSLLCLSFLHEFLYSV